MATRKILNLRFKINCMPYICGSYYISISIGQCCYVFFLELTVYIFLISFTLKNSLFEWTLQ